MKKIFFFSVLVFVCAFAVHKLYTAELDYANLSQSQAWTEWLIRVVQDVALWTAAFVAIVYSIWNYKNEQNRTKAIAYVALSVSFVLFQAAFLYYASHQMTVLVQDFTDPHPMQYSKQDAADFIASKTHTLDDKVRFSNMVAADIYQYTGASIDVIDEQGVIRPFQPSVSNMEVWKKLSQMKVQTQHMIKSFRYGCYSWLGVLFASLCVAGIAVAKRDRKERH